MANISTVKGFRDIFPPESLKRKKIREVIERNFRLFGFLPIETPTIEYEDVLRGDNESDEAVSDRFRLKDRGERELGLRFEFTFQLSRIFKENSGIKFPFKRYQIGSVFRDEALRPGKFREFTQCDADIIGNPSINADAECIALANAILNELKIKAEIKVNNRKLLNSMLEKAGIKNNQQQILRELDKLDKLKENEVKINLKKIISDKQIKEIFELLGKDLNYFVKSNFEGANEIKELEEFGKLYGFKIVFSPMLMRGFSYYTGNVWEIWAKENGVALSGGGRYDDKVGKFAGRQIPAVGISFGTLIDWPDVDIDDPGSLIVSLGEDKKAIELSQGLRNKNIPCTLMYGKLTKALEFANSYGINNVILIGSEEVKKKKLLLKNMKTGKEELLSENDIVKKLS